MINIELLNSKGLNDVEIGLALLEKKDLSYENIILLDNKLWNDCAICGAPYLLYRKDREKKEDGFMINFKNKGVCGKNKWYTYGIYDNT